MNPYLIIGLMAAWIASLVGVGYWQNEAGHVAERTKWQTRENNELREANAKILRLEEDARKAERDHGAVLAAISTHYEKELGDANKRREADHAAVRAGTLRLRDPNTAGLRACGSVMPETSPRAGGRDGRAPGELSGAAAEFLLDLAHDADNVARQLAACQGVVTADRQMGGR
jgi:prophage endopeptidase